MITKLLAMSGVARAGPPARAGAFTRARAGASYFPAATNRYVPRLHAPLECRWRIDPMTGALSAFWLDPSANTRAVAPVEQEPIDARRSFSRSASPARLSRPAACGLKQGGSVERRF
ncbi:MAG: hypothetical protein M3178_15385 [Pseudomonadota bacterium]|nr:hypothetical protein [Pseudomonadota bacterium]